MIAEKLLLYAERDGERAAALAEHLHIPVSTQAPAAGTLFLRLGENGLSLERDGLVIRGDFGAMLPRLKTNNLGGELLVRAAKGKSGETGTAVDATAGLGEDSFLLAAAGFSVRLYERDPVICALLADALDRAAREEALAGIVARMTLCEEDSVTALPALGFAPDVIYLDPMFPERQKSALVKKKFQLLHFLEPPCDDGEALLAAALAAKPRKIIVKRPLKAEFLAGVKPSHTLSGKAIRYDVIVR